MSIIMGVDPGSHTGIAIYEGGQLVELQTVEPHQLVEVIETGSGKAWIESNLKAGAK